MNPNSNEKRISLEVLQIASPCTASWDEMEGDARVRFCHQCQLNVFNLSDMPRQEAEQLVAQREGRLCVRFYRRADGTVLTRDCPVGLRAVRIKLGKMIAASAALAVALISGILFGRQAIQKLRTTTTNPVTTAISNNPFTRIQMWLSREPTHSAELGDFAVQGGAPPPTMPVALGKVCIPQPVIPANPTNSPALDVLPVVPELPFNKATQAE